MPVDAITVQAVPKAVEFYQKFNFHIFASHEKYVNSAIPWNECIAMYYLLTEVLLLEETKALSRVVRLKKTDEPIAIIGMSCRFPGGANTLDEYCLLSHLLPACPAQSRRYCR